MSANTVSHRRVLATLGLLKRVLPWATVDGTKETAGQGPLVFTLALAPTIYSGEYDGFLLRTINPSAGELDVTHLSLAEFKVTTGTGDTRRPLDKITSFTMGRLADGVDVDAIETAIRNHINHFTGAAASR